MRRLLLGGSLAGLLLIGPSGCGSHSDGPRAGDTVTPRLDKSITWTAGQPGTLGVRLQAKGKEDTKARDLDFIGSVKADPVATITYYAGETQLNAEKVTLSHRC